MTFSILKKNKNYLSPTIIHCSFFLMCRIIQAPCSFEIVRLFWFATFTIQVIIDEGLIFCSFGN